MPWRPPAWKAAVAAASPVVKATLPDAALFGFPPVGQAAPLAPAAVPASGMRPFNVPEEGVFAAGRDARVPLTVAALYAVAVAGLNRSNRSRARRPWAVSRTRLFRAGVVVHNLVLALYSAAASCRPEVRPAWPPRPTVSTASTGRLASAPPSTTRRPPAGRVPIRPARRPVHGPHLERGPGLLRLPLLPEQVLRGSRHLHTGQGQDQLDAADLPPRRCHDVHVGRHALHVRPIWMFILVNSLIHSLMYVLLHLGCLLRQGSPWC